MAACSPSCRKKNRRISRDAAEDLPAPRDGCTAPDGEEPSLGNLKAFTEEMKRYRAASSYSLANAIEWERSKNIPSVLL